MSDDMSELGEDAVAETGDDTAAADGVEDIDDLADDDHDDGEVGEPGDPNGPIDLGVYSVDELAALAPDRIDVLDGDEPNTAAGARALLAGGRVRLARSADGGLAGAPTEAAVVAGRFLAEPERIAVVRIDDPFVTEQYVLHGRGVDGTECYVLEGGTSGVRRLVFLLAEDAPRVIAELVGLDELGEVGNEGEPASDLDIEAEGVADTPFGQALARPLRSVTISAVAGTGAEHVDVSFVHGDDAAWIVEWTGETTARVAPLDAAEVSAALTRLLV